MVAYTKRERKHLEVSEKTHQRLKIYVAQMKIKTYDNAISQLLDKVEEVQ